MLRIVAAVGFALVFLFPAVRHAAADTTFTYVKIADTLTAIPGGTGNFLFFGQPSISNGLAVVRGEGPSGQVGLYTRVIDGVSPLMVRYDRNTVVPNTGGAGRFGFFSTPSVDGTAIAFSAPGSTGIGSPATAGVYTDFGGTLVAIADKTTPIPGGTGTFTSFGWPTLRNGEVVFRGKGAGQDGIYAFSGGTLRRVADLTTTVPGFGGVFTSFGPSDGAPMIDNGVVVFKGLTSKGGRGIYRDDNGTLSVVADLTTPIPMGTGNFTSFDTNFSFAGNVRDGSVAFVGEGDNQQGIYVHDGTTLSRIIDRHTVVPGTSATLFSFGGQGIGFDNGFVSFLGDASGTPQAVYATLGGVLRKVVVNNTLLPGTPGNPPGVSFAYGTYGYSLSGDMVAFHVGNFGGTFEHFAVFVAVASNDAPVAVNDATSVPEGGARTINVLANDSDPDGDVLSVISATSGQRGKVVCTAAGACTYTTTSASFNGSDSFTYTVSDGRGGTDVGTVAVTITPVDDADVGVMATASENPVGRGRQMTYQIVVTNNGPETARNVMLKDTLPAGTSLAAVKVSQGQVLTPPFGSDPGTVFVALGQLASHASATVHLTVNVLFAAKDPIVNVAEVANVSGDDPDSRNNTHQLMTRVVTVGTFVLTPAEQTVTVGERARLALQWTLPGVSWRELKDIQLRVRDPQGTVLHVRLVEGVPMLLSLFNEAGKFGPAGEPGGPSVLSGPNASVFLRGTTVQAAGPTSPTVTLTLDVDFKQATAGRRFAVEVMASDDIGNVQDWEPAGTLTVMPYRN